MDRQPSPLISETSFGQETHDMYRITQLSVFFAFLVLLPVELLGQSAAESDTIRELEQRVQRLESEVTQLRQLLLNDRLTNKLEGIWYQQSHMRNGQPITHADDVIWQLKPEKAYQWVLSPEPPMWELGTMEIDATQDPAWLTFKVQVNASSKKTTYAIPGIIKHEHERVYIALNEEARRKPNGDNQYADRPTEFESSKENGISLFILERRNTTK